MKYKTTWMEVASIWAGGVVSVTALLLGSTLISFLSFSYSILSASIGLFFVLISMSFLSYISVFKRGNLSEISKKSFGLEGAKYLIAIVVGLSTLGWFGVQSNIAGSSFSLIVKQNFELDISSGVSSVFWGFVMVLSAVMGFRFLKTLNIIAFPLVIVLIIFGFYQSVDSVFFDKILNYKPLKENGNLLKGIAITIGFFSVAAVISPDYNKNAKSAKDAIIGSWVGIFPTAIFLMIVGAVFSIVSKNYDIVVVFSSLGLPTTSLIILILSTWTTNVLNIYSSGMAIYPIFENKISRKYLTLIVGTLGMLLSYFGVLNKLVGFISLLTLTITPVAGVIISDFLFSKNESSINKFNIYGFISWVIGVLSVNIITSEYKYMIGIFVSFICYYTIIRIKKNNNE